MFLPPTIPPAEDSPDLTDEEVAHAIATESEAQFTQILAGELSAGHASVGKGDARYALLKHDIRRRSGNLFWRVYLGCPGEPDKVLVYTANWLQRGA